MHFFLSILFPFVLLYSVLFLFPSRQLHNLKRVGISPASFRGKRGAPGGAEDVFDFLLSLSLIWNNTPGISSPLGGGPPLPTGRRTGQHILTRGSGACFHNFQPATTTTGGVHAVRRKKRGGHANIYIIYKSKVFAVSFPFFVSPLFGVLQIGFNSV